MEPDKARITVWNGAIFIGAETLSLSVIFGRGVWMDTHKRVWMRSGTHRFRCRATGLEGRCERGCHCPREETKGAKA